jgi:uncharacterized Tic20 family protein
MSSEAPDGPQGISPPPPSEPAPHSSDEKMWAMVCHLSALAGYVGVPLGHILGPMVVWLIKKDDYPLVEDQGREALNFQISFTIYAVLCIPLMIILIGIPLLIALAIFNVVVIVIAAVKADEGAAYRYPLCIRLIK